MSDVIPESRGEEIKKKYINVLVSRMGQRYADAVKADANIKENWKKGGRMSWVVAALESARTKAEATAVMLKHELEKSVRKGEEADAEREKKRTKKMSAKTAETSLEVSSDDEDVAPSAKKSRTEDVAKKSRTEEFAPPAKKSRTEDVAPPAKKSRTKIVAPPAKKSRKATKHKAPRALETSSSSSGSSASSGDDSEHSNVSKRSTSSGDDTELPKIKDCKVNLERVARPSVSPSK